MIRTFRKSSTTAAISLLSIVGLVILLTTMDNLDSNGSRIEKFYNLCQEFRSSSFSGIVTNKYHDYGNKGFLTLEIDSETVRWKIVPAKRIVTDSIVQIGDSITKHMASSDFYVYPADSFRSNSLIKNNLHSCDTSYNLFHKMEK